MNDVEDAKLASLSQLIHNETMRNEITLIAVVCFNTPTSYDAEIMLRLPTPFKSRQLVVKKSLVSYEEAQKCADAFVSLLTQNVCDLIGDKVQELKHAKE